MRKNHLFSSCELMSDLSADILFIGEEAFCCICIGHDCEKATDKESLSVKSTSSGGSGGASTHSGNGLGIAGGALPPETRITVNGKTFCLADIDKEMTE